MDKLLLHTLHNIECAMYTVQCTLHTLHNFESVEYTVQCKLHILHNIESAMYTIRFTLSTKVADHRTMQIYAYFSLLDTVQH